MLADVASQNVRCLIVADPRSKCFEQVRAAVAETFADGVQYATGVIVVFEVDRGTPPDGLLLTAAADDAEVEVWHNAVAQKAFLLLGVVERVQTATQTQRGRRQLGEHDWVTLAIVLLAAFS